MLVSEVERDKKDSAGAQIREVYARRPPEYAIYRTDERVAIHFADDREQEQAQRSALVRLNPIRGEINGLIDGWRQRESLRAKALCYDRRVGDALTLAFEQDVASAELLLTQIRKDIVDERMARARFLYLIYSFAAVALAIAIFAFMNSGSLYSFPAQSWNLWFGAGSAQSARSSRSRSAFAAEPSSRTCTNSTTAWTPCCAW